MYLRRRQLLVNLYIMTEKESLHVNSRWSSRLLQCSYLWISMHVCILPTKINHSLTLYQMIMQQVIKAITDIHSKGVLHRDIKPENILIETGSDVPRVRIIDFGYGCLLHNGEHHQFSGEFLLFVLALFLQC